MNSNKRNVTQACDGCKRNHRRCDGTKPVCDYCRQRKLKCSWSHEPKKRGPKPKKVKIEPATSTISEELIYWKNKYMEALSDTKDQLPICSIETEKKLTSNQDIFSKCLFFFHEYILPLNPSFKFDISEQHRDIWNDLNLSKQEYFLLTNEKTMDQLIEDFKYSIIFAHGCIPIGEPAKSLQFIQKAAKLMDLLFCSKQVQVYKEKAQDLVSILNLFAEYEIYQNNPDNVRIIALQAYHLCLMYKDIIEPSLVHSSYTLMMVLAETYYDRQKWIDELIKIPNKYPALEARANFLMLLHQLKDNDNKSLAYSLSNGDIINIMIDSKIPPSTLESSLNTLSLMEKNLSSKDLPIQLLFWATQSLKSFLLLKSGNFCQACKTAEQTYEKILSLGKPIDLCPFSFSFSLVVIMLAACRSPHLQEALPTLEKIAHIYPKAKIYEPIVLKRIKHETIFQPEIQLLTPPQSFFQSSEVSSDDSISFPLYTPEDQTIFELFTSFDENLDIFPLTNSLLSAN